MPDRVDLVIEDERWAQVPLKRLAEDAVALALDAAGIVGPAEVEVALLACDDARIATLNSEFRGRDRATNVLSWPAHELFPDTPGGAPARALPPDPFGAVALGDIAIAWDTVAAEARSAGLRLEDHILHLILHACLHLLGYDHQTDADAARMEALEISALATRGVASPYEDKAPQGAGCGR